MNKINFVNNTTPALNATNLNKLQENVEDSINALETSQNAKIKTTVTTSNTDTYSCNYINGIIESGNNTAGNWLKFIDGTMICYFKSNSDIVAGANSITDYSITFPQQFYSIPLVSTIMNSDSSSPSIGYIQHSAVNPTTSGFTFRFFSKDDTSRVPYYGYIAIGRWK